MRAGAPPGLTGSDFAPGGYDTLIERDEAPRASFSLLGEMWVERGSKADWDLLKDLHYKENSLPIGPHFFRLTLRGETVGVIVTSNPKGLLKERHLVFPNLKPGSGETVATNTNRYHFANANFRVISRFVIDTMYRGIGAGYRMMNLVARMEGAPFMEIQSSMSKFNHFGTKAGFRFVKPLNSNKFDTGMRFFRLNFEANPQDYEALVAEIEALSPYARAKRLDTCRTWYIRNSPQEKTGGAGEIMASGLTRGQERVAAMDTHALVKALQQIVLSSPMYGVRANPEVGASIPDRLPLSAFDAQDPAQPLLWRS